MNWDLLEPILIIISIDIILGGDNAVVIALASRNLPEHQRNKAIFIGTGLAVASRVVLTTVALYLLAIPYLRLIGGLLLIYIAIKLLINEEDTTSIKSSDSLLSAIKTIVFADIVMGFDNVLAIAGASHGNVTLVVMGLLISVPIIIWGSRIILKLMEKFPILVYIGAGILAFTAAEMILEDPHVEEWIHVIAPIMTVFPFVVVLVTIMFGYFYNKQVAEK
ncbi:membrane protein [Halobacillus andaensis]|uniref:Membrane protein n=1 Tax=Halobacillus andaensis TaxID=1176239 RepID=A0A917EUH4_HALAA|nr:TerC family protein [Halobacillus andaensis]MBP2004049.1 YjbE family integral membrane protein [Halobacillus andaensis]GGF15392.1 membrane protein [Halobacillus andaensis]